MDVCYAQPIYFQIGQFNMAAFAAAFLIALIARDKRTSLLSVVTFFFFWLSVSFHCEIKALDVDGVWRYFFWTSIDILYVFTVVCMARRGIVTALQLFLIISLHCVAWGMQVFRLVDLHLLGSNHKEFYSLVITIYNAALWFVVAVPLAPWFMEKLRRSYSW